MQESTSDSKQAQPSRRDAIGGMAAGLVLAGASISSAANGDMPTRALGSTGVNVSMLGLGGSHIGQVKDQSEATRLIRSAIDRGLTFMDNCWDYNDGRSEEWMGNALTDGYRQKCFLMTKVDGRTKEEAAKQIDESLKRLKTDHVDLMQFHEVIRFDDPDRFFAPGGALEAFQAAKKAGKMRFLGFTGHKDPHIHLYMLEQADSHGFRFDTIQMPINVMDAHFRSFSRLVVPEVAKRRMGLLGMKSMGSAVILGSKAVTPVECLQYALSLPTSVVITGIDSQKILDQAFEVARTFRPLNETQINALLQKTAEAAKNGEWELFKTTSHFDSTAKHPEWLGGETEATKRKAKG
jgi:predicted aldo/keto reductase-like oxidoreductase